MRFVVLFLLGVTGCSTAVAPVPKQLASCPVGSTYEVRVSPDLPVAWQDATSLAVDRWSWVLGPTFPHRVTVTAAVEDPPSTPCVISVLPGGVDSRAWAKALRFPQGEGTRPTTAAIYTDVSDPHLTQDIADASMVHELGHVLGLDHDTVPSDLTAMWPVIRGTGQIGCVDAVAACSVWACVPGCDGNVFISDL